MAKWPDPPERNQPTVTEGPDGERRMTWEMNLSSDTVRPVADDIIRAVDDALGVHGEVLHALDPSRMQTFEAGGPSVWSVGIVRVEAATPYFLLLTYGMSRYITDNAAREHYTHEYSLAIPATADEPPAWGVALLKHLCAYVLRTGAELQIGDNMPCGHAITQIAFAPEHHSEIPSSTLEGLLVTEDPILDPIPTSMGPIQVRRFVGVHPAEITRVTTWNSRAFLEEWSKDAPLLLTDPQRTTVLTGDLAVRCEARAKTEGGSVGVLYVEGGWSPVDGGVQVHFPGGENAQKILDMIDARLPFERPLVLRGPPSTGPVAFYPADAFQLAMEEGMLIICGKRGDREFEQVLLFIDPTQPGSTVTFRG